MTHVTTHLFTALVFSVVHLVSIPAQRRPRDVSRAAADVWGNPV